MSRRMRLALGALALAVIGLHLGLLGGLQAASTGVDTRPPAPAPLAIETGPSPLAVGLAPTPGRAPAPEPLLADAERPAIQALPSPLAAASVPARVAVPASAPASPSVSALPAAASSPRGASRPPATPASGAAAPASASAPRPALVQPSAQPDPVRASASAPDLPDAPATPAAGSVPAALAQPSSELPGPAVLPAVGAPSGPAAALPPLPVYRTRIPPAARITYRLSRGMIVGTGELDWRPQAGGYQLRLEGKLPLIGTLITQTSRGRFDAAGLAPERHTDQRLRRSEQAANFQREPGVVSFSGGARPLPIVPGLQDRLSVMVQLAAIAAAGPQPPPAGQALSIGVVGARGDSALWLLRFEGVQAIDTPDGPVKAWRYLRQPESPHDTAAEFWLDPTRQFLPARVKLTDGSSEPLELRRQAHEP